MLVTKETAVLKATAGLTPASPCDSQVCSARGSTRASRYSHDSARRSDEDVYTRAM
ncbi:Uncharacterised protein [Mycobacteroides abscessus subsp. abscessus]|nr:Uncharacterised protein [Mycobacteroides abscessus subsp. abscessus]